MINRVVLVGRLTKDPELRYTPSGVAVATFTLAVNRTFTNAQGEREADFINCIAWRKTAESVANFLKKGSLAGLDGRLQSRSYEDQNGKKVYVTEVIADSVQFLEPRGSGGSNPNPKPTPTPTPTPDDRRGTDIGEWGWDGKGSNDTGRIDITDDDLPF